MKTIKQNLFTISILLTSISECDITSLLTRSWQAYFSRKYNLVKVMADKAVEIPVIADLGRWYGTVANRDNRDVRELEMIAESANPLARSLALSTLANEDLRNNIVTPDTIKLVLQSRKIAIDLNHVFNFYQTQNQLSLISSICGDHDKSLNVLRGLEPVIRRFGPEYEAVRADFYNSVAYELLQVGNLKAAQYFITIPLASPFLSVYPEWLDTAMRIKAATHTSPLQIPGHDATPENVIAWVARPEPPVTGTINCYIDGEFYDSLAVAPDDYALFRDYFVLALKSVLQKDESVTLPLSFIYCLRDREEVIGESAIPVSRLSQLRSIFSDPKFSKPASIKRPVNIDKEQLA